MLIFDGEINPRADGNCSLARVLEADGLLDSLEEMDFFKCLWANGNTSR